MDNKKILISANVLFTITNFRKDLIKFLKKQKFEVVCISDLDNLSESSLLMLQELNVRFIKTKVNRKGVNPIEDFKYLLELIKVYKKEKPDVILHFTIKPNIYGTIASKLLSIPSINTINGLGSGLIKNNFLSKILKCLYKFSLLFSSKVFFQNKDDLSFFIKENLVSEKKVDIVPGSGVNTKAFEGCESTNNRLTFLLVARLLKDKGIYEYIDAIQKLSIDRNKCRFLLAGQFDFDNPSAISEVEIRKWENENIIEFLGKTDNIKEFFKLSDIIVLPSYREGLSRVLIEAASASKPIITTNVAGCKDVVINNRNGFLCNLKDSESLKNCIEKMYNLTYEDRKSMANYSKEYAIETFDKDIVNNIYYDAIIEFI